MLDKVHCKGDIHIWKISISNVGFNLGSHNHFSHQAMRETGIIEMFSYVLSFYDPRRKTFQMTLHHFLDDLI